MWSFSGKSSQKPPVDRAKSQPDRGTISQLAFLFLKLGTIGFGGPAAHVALMEDEVVQRRGWLTREKFFDLVGATHLIPGPNSTELAIHIGYLRAGWPGLIVAGSCFILPAAIIVCAIAFLYANFGKLPEVLRIFWAVKPVIIAVILLALIRFGQTALKTKFLTILAFSAVVLNVLGVHELVLLLGAGLLCALTAWRPTKNSRLGIAPLFFAALPLSTASSISFSLSGLFFFFLKVGSVLFGSGYVLLAFLRADLVERWHWLTQSQLIDAITVGQVTPGPVFTTATFIGYLLGSWNGAVLATIGIFLPAFVFVAISGPLVPKIRHSVVAGSALDGITAVSLSLMATVTWNLASVVLVQTIPWIIFLVSLVLLFRFRVNSFWLILSGAMIGVISWLIQKG